MHLRAKRGVLPPTDTGWRLDFYFVLVEQLLGTEENGRGESKFYLGTNARLPFVHGNMGNLTVSLLCRSLIKVKLGGSQGPSQSCDSIPWTTQSSPQ